MKKILQSVLLTGILCSTALIQSIALTPENTVIAHDIDGVILNLPKSQWPVIAYKSVKLIHNKEDMVDLPKTLWYMYKGFTQKTNGVKGIRDEHGNKVEGLTAQMITLGMHHKEATRFVAPILEIIEDSRQLDHNVIKTIKNTNLPIVWATNKDSLTYQRAAKKHGLDAIANKAIVTKYPLSNGVLKYAQRADTPANYRQLVEQYDNDKETETIIHAPSQKPDLEYFERMAAVVGPEKNIIFLDDKKKNIAGYNQLPSSDTAQRIGIHFKNVAQLKNELNKLGL